MKIIWLCAVVLMLSSCAHDPSLERTDRFCVEINQRWDAPEYCQSIMFRPGAIACAIQHTPVGCRIFIQPDEFGDIYWHEIKHCFLGSYHGK